MCCHRYPAGFFFQWWAMRPFFLKKKNEIKTMLWHGLIQDYHVFGEEIYSETYFMRAV